MEIHTKFCPSCKGTRITAFAGGATGMWQCKDCGFLNAVFPEKIERKEIKKIKIENGRRRKRK